MKLTGAQIIVEALIDQGCDTVFGYPGGQVLNIYDELYKNSDRITHVLTAHEQVPPMRRTDMQGQRVRLELLLQPQDRAPQTLLPELPRRILIRRLWWLLPATYRLILSDATASRRLTLWVSPFRLQSIII